MTPVFSFQRMKKYLSLLAIFVFAAASVSFTKEECPDLIELKNGKKYTGVLMAQGSQIQFDADGVGLLFFNASEVEHIRRNSKGNLNGSSRTVTNQTVRRCQR